MWKKSPAPHPIRPWGIACFGRPWLDSAASDPIHLQPAHRSSLELASMLFPSSLQQVRCRYVRDRHTARAHYCRSNVRSTPGEQSRTLPIGSKY